MHAFIRAFKTFIPAVILTALLVIPTVAQAAERLPNFVILFADDLGYGDLGCYGHPTIKTPNLDRMAAEGMRFTQFYSAAPVCTPSRAALMTGRLPVRNGMGGITRRVLFPDSALGLPTSEITIAEALKTKGYATACVGKWHLGHLPKYLPTSNGFDEYFGIPYSNDMHKSPGEVQGVPLMRGVEIIEQPVVQETLTPRYTAEAIRFIKQNKSKPFFLYLPYTFPHVPLFASERFRDTSLRGLYGDAVEEIDWSVGEVLNTLREQGLADNTLVFFTSDNGPWLIKKLHGGSAGLLRDGKGSTFEGGMREPGLAWWPGKIKPSTVCYEIASTMDMFPTLLTLAGVKLPEDRILDGRDVSPVLLDKGKPEQKPFFYYNNSTLMAVRKGAYKAHLSSYSPYTQKQAMPHDPPLLFNLLHDPSEQYNIAKDHPEIVADLLREIDQHRANLKPAESQLEALINETDVKKNKKKE